MWPLALFAALAVAVFVDFGSSKRSRPPRRVTVDDEHVERLLGNGTVESVRWSELQEVWVVTNDEGPFLDDCFICLVGPDRRGCLVSTADASSKAVVDRVLGLPGFDHTKFVRAMGSTENARFVCWKRPDAVA